MRLPRPVLCLLLVSLGPFAGAEPLPRSAPEAQGVATEGIEEFVHALSHHSRQEPHSLMVLRHGRVVAEGWWAPYAPELNHGLYSLSKSFTSTAAGIAVAEGRLSVEDKVVKFFSDKLPAEVPARLAQMRVKDLLTMSTGQAKEPTWEMVRGRDWPAHFLAAPVDREPGSVFQYNSAATYMASAIVGKVAGMPVREYLEDRLFAPLGIEGATWDVCPAGQSVGGWGLSVTTEALARFGQMLLQKGSWQGRQILPAAWVAEATTAHILQPRAERPGRPHEENDWVQGYGYQFWRCTHGAYRGDGAFGQFLVVLPRQDAVIAITGESHDLQGVLDLVWSYLLPAFKDEALPPNDEAARRLRGLMASLKHDPPPANRDAAPADFPDRVYALDTNALELASFSLALTPDGGKLAFRDAEGSYEIPFGFDRWERGRVSLPGAPPSLVFREARKPPRPLVTAAAAGWKDANTLVAVIRYLETPHHDTLTCTLADAGGVTLRFQQSLGGQDRRPALTGRRVNPGS